MTHQEQYDAIINFRKSNPLPGGQYGENHHIVPKSICPILKDSPDNIVRLSAQEHFLAHYHLWLAYRDELKEKTWAKKMCFAFRQMKRQLLKCDDVEKMSELYEKTRIDFCKYNSERLKGNTFFKGKHHTNESKKKLSDSHKGLIPWNAGKNTSGFQGKHHLEKTKQRMHDAQCGHKAVAFGKHWYTNGIINIFAKTCPEGFVRGRLSKKECK